MYLCGVCLLIKGEIVWIEKGFYDRMPGVILMVLICLSFWESFLVFPYWLGPTYTPILTTIGYVVAWLTVGSLISNLFWFDFVCSESRHSQDWRIPVIQDFKEMVICWTLFWPLAIGSFLYRKVVRKRLAKAFEAVVLPVVNNIGQGLSWSYMKLSKRAELVRNPEEE